MHRRISTIALAAAAVLVVGGCAATASHSLVPRSGVWMTPGDSGAFFTTLGTDTVAIERFVLVGNTLTSEAVTRSPRTVRYSLRMQWTDEGNLSSYEVTQRGPRPPGDSVIARTTMTVRGDSAYWTTTARGQTRNATTSVSAPRGIFNPPLYSPYMVMARIALARGDSMSALVSQGPSPNMRVSRPDPAWLAFSHGELGTVRLRLDPIWRTFEVDASGSTLGHRAMRVTTADIAGWARHFAERDVAGTGLGMLSLPDSVRATVGSANIAINYHRPAVRGRTIFGGLVPWNQVWRTGANAATGFTTDRDLLIGGTRVPAGSYTLWSIPSPTGWQLILNRRTGQWGTQYDAAHDLAHIPMTVRQLSSPAERFTITVQPDGSASALTFAWDRTMAWVPIAEAPQP